MPQVVPEFAKAGLAVLAGYGIKRLGWVTEDDGKALAKLLINVLIPSLLVVTFWTQNQKNGTPIPVLETFVQPAICVGWACLLGLLPGWLFFGLRARNDRVKGVTPRYAPDRLGMTIACSLGWNIGMFGFPIIQQLFGAEGFKYIALFDIGNVILTYGVSYYVVVVYAPGESQFDCKRVLVRIFSARPLQAAFIGMIMSLTGLPVWQFAADWLEFVGKSNAPISLLILGVYLDFSKWRLQNAVHCMQVLVIRFAPSVLVFTGIALFRPKLLVNVEEVVTLLCFLMPCGLIVIPYSLEFGYDVHFVSMLVNVSMVASLILMTVALVVITAVQDRQGNVNFAGAWWIVLLVIGGLGGIAAAAVAFTNRRLQSSTPRRPVSDQGLELKTPFTQHEVKV